MVYFSNRFDDRFDDCKKTFRKKVAATDPAMIIVSRKKEDISKPGVVKKLPSRGHKLENLHHPKKNPTSLDKTYDNSNYDGYGDRYQASLEASVSRLPDGTEALAMSAAMSKSFESGCFNGISDDADNDGEMRKNGKRQLLLSQSTPALGDVINSSKGW